MRVGVKLLLVALAVTAAGVLIGFYVSHLTKLAGSPAYAVPVQQANGQPVVHLEIQTVAAIGPKLSPNPDWVSYLIHTPSGWKRETVWDLPANATVHVTWSQLRRRERPAQPVLRPTAGDGREPDRPRRQACVEHRSERRLAHLRGAGPRDHRRRSRSCRRRQEPVRLRAVLAEDRAPDGPVHVPHRRRPATSAGSASSPARPGGSTASAGRCRRSDTWTASST